MIQKTRLMKILLNPLMWIKSDSPVCSVLKVIYVDEDGRPLTPTSKVYTEDTQSTKSGAKQRPPEIDTRHLYAVSF